MTEDLNLCCIAIPLYKENPSSRELASLKQLITVLADFQMYFICPPNFSSLKYDEITTNHNSLTLEKQTFDRTYFSSIDGYNKLLISPQFYKRFKRFDYLLVYQLDAWVFTNQLRYWCKQNFDYMGAPWAHKDPDGIIRFDGVGNGGFSLRKIASHIKVLNSFSLQKKIGYLVYIFQKKKSFISLIYLLKGISFWNNTYHLFNDYKDNEDKFWGLIVNRNFEWFKVPNEETAKLFSVEVFPSDLITADKLPFGCHAWEKHDPDFWMKYMKA